MKRQDCYVNVKSLSNPAKRGWPYYFG